eukprot:CAMPEP_0172692784 /NCGR_PEP_ID=MMETSP1074-20121228/25510_1 /TAXON_ID=2916 /ORGANISM="Ceratium fusus, Strain PA161109" /LENGTH=216 /DNA_ID=CAMNT_0013513051 /DNA_START=64 /DNA_END=714 /DNA_ORIENTATION=+
MQVEIGELRNALQSEHQQRVYELSGCRREILDLQHRLVQQHTEQTMQHQTVSSALTNEIELRGGQIETLKSQMALVLRRSEVIQPLKELETKHFEKLVNDLEKANVDRRTSCDKLEDKLNLEIENREHQCQRISEEVGLQKARVEADFAQDRERIDCLTQNVQLAGEMMTTGSYDHIERSTLRSSDSLLGSMLSSMPTTGSGFRPSQPVDEPSTAD